MQVGDRVRFVGLNPERQNYPSMERYVGRVGKITGRSYFAQEVEGDPSWSVNFGCSVRHRTRILYESELELA